MSRVLAVPMYAIPSRKSAAADEWKEYYYLQGMVSDFNKDCLEVKKWSVALAAIVAGVGQSSLANPKPMFVIVMLLAIAFWGTETFWRMNQWAFIRRIREIEATSAGCPAISSGWARFYIGPSNAVRPNTDWNGVEGESNGLRFLANLLALRTCLPHAFIIAAALFFWLDPCHFLPGSPPPPAPQRVAGVLDVHLVGADHGPLPAPAAAGQPAPGGHR